MPSGMIIYGSNRFRPVVLGAPTTKNAVGMTDMRLSLFTVKSER